jgi:hypothetical protein
VIEVAESDAAGMPWTAPQVVRSDTRIGGATGVLILPPDHRPKGSEDSPLTCGNSRARGLLMAPRRV